MRIQKIITAANKTLSNWKDREKGKRGTAKQIYVCYLAAKELRLLGLTLLDVGNYIGMNRSGTWKLLNMYKPKLRTDELEQIFYENLEIK